MAEFVDAPLTSDDCESILRRQFRVYYHNSVAQMTMLVFMLSGLVSFISAFIAYKLIAAYINFIAWKFNVLRGFGIAKREFLLATMVQLLTVGVASIVGVLALAIPIEQWFTAAILDSTDTYIAVKVSNVPIVLTIAEVAIFSFMIGIASYRRMTRVSIYQQYIANSTRN